MVELGYTQAVDVTLVADSQDNRKKQQVHCLKWVTPKNYCYQKMHIAMNYFRIPESVKIAIKFSGML
jgi:hypothetical protein